MGDWDARATHVKLTTKSEYSLLAMIYIARHERDGFTKIEDICSEYGLPRKFLEQLLSVLKQNRYVHLDGEARRRASPNEPEDFLDFFVDEFYARCYNPPLVALASVGSGRRRTWWGIRTGQHR